MRKLMLMALLLSACGGGGVNSVNVSNTPAPEAQNAPVDRADPEPVDLPEFKVPDIGGITRRFPTKPPPAHSLPHEWQEWRDSAEVLTPGETIRLSAEAYLGFELADRSADDQLRLLADSEVSTRLGGIDAHGSDVTDSGLVHLAAMPQLNGFDLGNCRSVTDAGIEHLRVLKGLVALNLGETTGITNAALKTLETLPALRMLHLAGCDGITDEAVSAWQQSHPDVQVSR